MYRYPILISDCWSWIFGSSLFKLWLICDAIHPSIIKSSILYCIAARDVFIISLWQTAVDKIFRLFKSWKLEAPSSLIIIKFKLFDTKYIAEGTADRNIALVLTLISFWTSSLFFVEELRKQRVTERRNLNISEKNGTVCVSYLYPPLVIVAFVNREIEQVKINWVQTANVFCIAWELDAELVWWSVWVYFLAQIITPREWRVWGALMSLYKLCPPTNYTSSYT